MWFSLFFHFVIMPNPLDGVGQEMKCALHGAISFYSFSCRLISCRELSLA